MNLDRATPGDLLALLRDAADAIADALDHGRDWGLAGTVPGQHHSDLRADEAAAEVLRGAGVALLSEESGLSGDPGPVTVVVDPLDGSTNASRGVSWWATSLCAVDEWGPVASLVVDLRHGVAWSASREEGAWRDGEPIEASRCRSIGEAIVAVNGVPAPDPRWGQFRCLGAAALDLCAVADGTLDAYLDCTTDELGVWDYAGAWLVCSEAGVAIDDVWGRDLIVLDHLARRTPLAADPAFIEDLRRHHPVVDRAI